MSLLKEKLASTIPGIRDTVHTLAKEHGEKVVSLVTLGQVLGGMRGVNGLVCETSEVDPNQGLKLRGRSIMEFTESLPEETFYLLCTGEMPDEASLTDLQKEFRKDRKSVV
jgi:citrate synthase